MTTEEEQALAWAEDQTLRTREDLSWCASILAYSLRSCQEELAAYKKAKSENDDRFMNERDQARAENEALKQNFPELACPSCGFPKDDYDGPGYVGMKYRAEKAEAELAATKEQKSILLDVVQGLENKVLDYIVRTNKADAYADRLKYALKTLEEENARMMVALNQAKAELNYGCRQCFTASITIDAALPSAGKECSGWDCARGKTCPSCDAPTPPQPGQEGQIFSLNTNKRKEK